MDSIKGQILNLKKFNKSKGFTLTELMVTVMIGSIVLTMGIPEFREFSLNQRVQTSSHAFVRSLNMARQEAIKRGSPVGVCALNGTQCNNGSWENGWVVFADDNQNGSFDPQADTVIYQQDGLADAIDMEGADNMVMFEGSGYLSSGTGNYDIHSHECKSSDYIEVNISSTGRTNLNRTECH